MFFKENFRNVFVIIFAPIVLLFFIDSSDASNQCKTKVQNLIIKQCSGARNRRDLENNNEKHSIEIMKSYSALKDDKFIHYREKRQIQNTGVTFASVAGPLVSRIVNGALSLSPIRALAAPPAASAPIITIAVPAPYIIPRFYLGNSPPEPKFTGGLLTQERSDGELVFDLSMNEADALYAELSERLPRELKDTDAAQKMFFRMAAECCRKFEDCDIKDFMKCV